MTLVKGNTEDFTQGVPTECMDVTYVCESWTIKKAEAHYHHNYLGPSPPFPHVLLLEAPLFSGPVFHLCHSPPGHRKFTHE